MIKMVCNLRDGDSTLKLADEAVWTMFQSDTPLAGGAVLKLLTNQRVLVVYHGYNVPDEVESMAEVVVRIDDWNAYDVVIFMRWPGGKLYSFLGRLSSKILGWFKIKTVYTRATEAGKQFAKEWPSNVVACVDGEGHSMGCRVLMSAACGGIRFRNILLAAAAIDNEALSTEFKDAQCAKIVVAFSKRDPVLAFGYTVTR